MTHGISAIVIAYNQRDLLEKCLASLKDWVNEIIVIDLMSQDNIAEIAKQYGAKYHLLPHVDVVELVRQKTIPYAKYDYIFFVDPDETIPTTLAKELVRLTKEGNVDYFETPRQNYVFGAWVKASRWWPDYQVRFFKKGALTWPKRLHAQPIVKGISHHFAPDPAYALIHQNYSNLDEWFEKNRRYAKSDAQNRLDSNEEFNLFVAMRLSISEFVSRYFAGRGVNDGMRGLILAILQSFYYFLVYAYYWEGKKYAELEDPKSLHNFPRSWFSHGLSEIMHWDSAKMNFVKKIKSKFVRKMIA